MVYFPLSLVKYSRANGCPIGWIDFKSDPAAVSPFTAAGNICAVQLDADQASFSPAMENFVLGFELRHPEFDIDDDSVGISAIQSAFYAFLDSLRGTDLDDNFTVDSLEEIVDQHHVFGYTDNHWTFFTRVRFTVEDHSRS